MIEIFTKIVEMFEQQPDIAKMGFLSAFFKTTPVGFNVQFERADKIPG
jgi:hypothetical protein